MQHRKESDRHLMRTGANRRPQASANDDEQEDGDDDEEHKDKRSGIRHPPMPGRGVLNPGGAGVASAPGPCGDVSRDWEPWSRS